MRTRKRLSISGVEVQKRLIFVFSDYHVQITVKRTEGINTATKLSRDNETMSLCLVQDCLRNIALQSLDIEITWVASTYLSSFHSSSHFLESRAKFSNEVMLSIGIPVPNYALGRQRGKEQKNTFFLQIQNRFHWKILQEKLRYGLGEVFFCLEGDHKTLKTYSCPDQNKMTSRISTQIATDSCKLWSCLIK